MGRRKGRRAGQYFKTKKRAAAMSTQPYSTYPGGPLYQFTEQSDRWEGRRKGKADKCKNPRLNCAQYQNEEARAQAVFTVGFYVPESTISQTHSPSVPWKAPGQQCCPGPGQLT